MKKYFILMAAVIIQICVGVGYSWGTFVPALKQTFGLSITQTETIFGAGSYAHAFLIFGSLVFISIFLFYLSTGKRRRVIDYQVFVSPFEIFKIVIPSSTGASCL
jgi:hypothetical protein